MLYQIRAPRIDMNEDRVTVTEILVAPDTFVRKGGDVAIVETMKSSVVVTSSRDGFVRKIFPKVGDEIPIGQPIMDLTESLDDPYSESNNLLEPDDLEEDEPDQASNKPNISRKARLLAKKAGIDLAQITPVDGSIRTEDVERFYASHSKLQDGHLTPDSSPRPMTRYEIAACDIVEWSTAHAAPAYLEKIINSSRLSKTAEDIQKDRGLLFRPETSLLAWIFAQTISSNKELNASQEMRTLISYDQINLGFTIDFKGRLQFPVLRDADNYSRDEFIDTLSELQRRAQKGKLTPEELTGATIGFSSLAAYGITQHKPILYPHTSIMLAHSAPLPFSIADAEYVTIGVTYDHKVHSGATIARFLNAIERNISNLTASKI
jgi:pyruvate/2-oxoglutarate dehydrogenase complex dihydrolipoamide acyltransferase (E2) component